MTRYYDKHKAIFKTKEKAQAFIKDHKNERFFQLSKTREGWQAWGYIISR